MVRTCCVSMCRSNYPSSKKEGYYTCFRFPKDEQHKLSWLKVIPRKNLILSSNSFVCEKHFDANDIIKYDKHLLPDGTTKLLLLRSPKLKQGAVPNHFPNLPPYLTKPTKIQTGSILSLEGEQLSVGTVMSEDENLGYQNKLVDSKVKIEEISFTEQLPVGTVMSGDENLGYQVKLEDSEVKIEEISFTEHFIDIKEEIDDTSNSSGITFLQSTEGGDENLGYQVKLEDSEVKSEEISFTEHFIDIKEEIDDASNSSGITILQSNGGDRSEPEDHTYSTPNNEENDVANVEVKLEDDDSTDSKLEYSDYYNCHSCNFATDEEVLLRIHVDYIHLKLYQFKCHSCNYSASDKKSLENHIDKIHLNLNIHECQICSKIFMSSPSLNNHIRSSHADSIKHYCDMCDYSTRGESFLISHKLTAHPYAFQSYKCEMCDSAFKEKSNLEVHVNRVHLKFKCTLCKYATTKKTHLDGHIDSIHLKMKNHQCHLCNFSANSTARLRTHQKSVHFKRRFKCYLCEYEASAKRYVKKHMESVHLEIKHNIINELSFNSQ